PVKTLTARRHPCLPGCDESFKRALEIGISPGACIQEILLPGCLEPILVPAHIKRVGAHRDEVDEIGRIDAAEEGLAFDKPLIQDPGEGCMPDTAVRSSIGHELL